MTIYLQLHHHNPDHQAPARSSLHNDLKNKMIGKHEHIPRRKKQKSNDSDQMNGTTYLRAF